METTFVAAFPGLFLNSIDCNLIIKDLFKTYDYKYAINIGNECSTGLKFTFSYVPSYKKQIYDLFEKKGPNEYERAKKLSFFFDQTFECELCYFTLLKIKIKIPKKSENLIRMIKTEARFQLYQFSKDIFAVVKRIEKMVSTEFKLFYTCVGEDGTDGLRKRFSPGLKRSMRADFKNCEVRVENERKKFGSTTGFPLSVLGPVKRNSFVTLMEHRSFVEKISRNSLERNWLFLLERLSFAEDNMTLPIRNLKEGFTIYQRIIDGYDKIEEMYTFQLEVTGLFMHIIALSLAITAIFFEIGINLMSGTFAGAIILLFLGEIYLLYKYNIGPMISRELDYLSSELKRKDI